MDAPASLANWRTAKLAVALGGAAPATAASLAICRQCCLPFRKIADDMVLVSDGYVAIYGDVCSSKARSKRFSKPSGDVEQGSLNQFETYTDMAPIMPFACNLLV